MSKHTPGPWNAAAKPSSVVGWPIVGPGGRLIADVTYAWRGSHDPKIAGDSAFNAESRANAHLIAAAPDLLDALRELLPEGWGDDGTMDHMPGVAKARAAIAKAEGRS